MVVLPVHSCILHPLNPSLNLNKLSDPGRRVFLDVAHPQVVRIGTVMAAYVNISPKP